MAWNTGNSGTTRGSDAARVSASRPCSTADIERCSSWMMRIDLRMTISLKAKQAAPQLLAESAGMSKPVRAECEDEAPGKPAPGAQPPGQPSGGEQEGQRAQAEGGHGGGALHRAAGQRRGRERAVDHRAGQPAPEEPGGIGARERSTGKEPRR